MRRAEDPRHVPAAEWRATAISLRAQVRSQEQQLRAAGAPRAQRVAETEALRRLAARCEREAGLIRSDGANENS